MEGCQVIYEALHSHLILQQEALYRHSRNYVCFRDCRCRVLGSLAALPKPCRLCNPSGAVHVSPVVTHHTLHSLSENITKHSANDIVCGYRSTDSRKPPGTFTSHLTCRKYPLHYPSNDSQRWLEAARIDTHKHEKHTIRKPQSSLCALHLNRLAFRPTPDSAAIPPGAETEHCM